MLFLASARDAFEIPEAAIPSTRPDCLTRDHEKKRRATAATVGFTLHEIP
jgi:hypothetical protein